MSSGNGTTEPATRRSAKDQPGIIADLTKRFKVEIGKSAQTIIAIAAIVNDAVSMIEGRDRYLEWLKGDCKMSESQGSKYLGIHRNPYLHDPKYYMQLPPEMSLWWLLSRLKTKKLFAEGLKYVLDNDPTYAALDVFVAGLLGNPNKKKHTLFRPEKDLVVNQKDIAAAVRKQTAQANRKAADAKAEAEQARSELAAFKKQAARSEPTPARITAELQFDYDDGENLVRLELVKSGYSELQRKKLAKKEALKKIAALLHAEGLRNVEAVIRDRQAPMARKAAA